MKASLKERPLEHSNYDEKLGDVGISVCLPWVVNKQKYTQLSRRCGMPLLFPLHFVFCFTIAMILLDRACFACLCPTRLPLSVSSRRTGSMLSCVMCSRYHTAACNKDLYWQEALRCGQYVQEFLGKPEEHCCPRHMVGSTQQTHLQSERQTRVNLLGTCQSPKTTA